MQLLSNVGQVRLVSPLIQMRGVGFYFLDQPNLNSAESIVCVTSDEQIERALAGLGITEPRAIAAMLQTYFRYHFVLCCIIPKVCLLSVRLKDSSKTAEHLNTLVSGIGEFLCVFTLYNVIATESQCCL